MSEERRPGTSWYVNGAALGVLFGALATVVVAWVSPQERPDKESTVHGGVRAKLGAACAPLDRGLAERLYGAGTVQRDDAVTKGEHTVCEWASGRYRVIVEVDLSDYPEGGEAQAAHDSYVTDRIRAEEGDPASGLPIPVRRVGDEAYAVHDPKRERRDREAARVQARSGNVLLAVSVIRDARAPVVGEQRMVRQARQLTAAAVSRLPDP